MPEEDPIPFDHEVLWEDRDLIVVDKPAFLPATSNGRLVRETVQTRLRVAYGNDDIVSLHRLDRLTRGVLLCSRRAETRGAYQRLFQDRRVSKVYHARVHGTPVEGRVELDLRRRLGGRGVDVVGAGQGTTTVTDISVVDGDRGIVEVRPLTGFTHQIRAVLNHLGMPIVGDDTYPVDRGLSLYDFSTPLHLRASSIEFSDPLQEGVIRAFRSRQDLSE